MNFIKMGFNNSVCVLHVHFHIFKDRTSPDFQEFLLLDLVNDSKPYSIDLLFHYLDFWPCHCVLNIF